MNHAWRFPMPAAKGPRRPSISSVTIRQTTGADEDVARKMAEARGSADVVEDLMRIAILKVDDEVVDQPFTGMREWNLRTRSLVRDAWLVINGVLPDARAAVSASAQAGDGCSWVFTVPAPAKTDRFAAMKLCEISTFVVRELTGGEESEVLRKAGEQKQLEGVARLLAAVVSVDGAPLTVERFDAMSSRARRFLIEGYALLNGAQEEEALDFLQGASEDTEDSALGVSTEESSSATG